MSVELNSELLKLVESRMESTLKAIEETLKQILEDHEISLKDLKATMKSLEERFNFLSQKWNLQILFILFLKATMGFSELKKTLGVNSRTLSDKLAGLTIHNYLKRSVDSGPPLRVNYSLTTRGRNTILLALPLLYHSRINGELSS